MDCRSRTRSKGCRVSADRRGAGCEGITAETAGSLCRGGTYGFRVRWSVVRARLVRIQNRLGEKQSRS